MQIQCYLYPNIIEIQLWDPTIFSPRNRVVYSRPIKVYQGIDNPMQLVIKNQDQKPVNVTGYLVQLDIQDPLAQGSVESLAITMVDTTKGLGKVTIPKEVVNSLDQRIYKLTIKLIDQATNIERPLFIDDNFTALLDLQVLPGWYESMPLTLNGDEVLDAGTI
ncbi:hypothetical protein UFOVP257_116 [uncultured Caudovirales phage]|uniref:Uncharacterized protein n=1 Tax=uncultured Caudovirales phage TaxID=2100421 RepID=A0A6J5LJK2_9CAUD|nr:hypothetical protein UFOVP257_116 [uncultured Caudovirales phage]